MTVTNYSSLYNRSKAASLPCMDGSLVFAKCRQCSPT